MSGTNLPASRVGLIGREADLLTLIERMRSVPGRLVTISGIGGIGKTSLALTVARHVTTSFRDGVWLADLSGVKVPEAVSQSVAGAIGVRERPGSDVTAALAAFLRDKQLLLLLDNCEHLVDACAALVDDLLDSAPELCILATSREPLRVGGETTYPLQPLAVPSTMQPTDLDSLSQCPSVALFLSRAQALRPDFELTIGNAPTVAEVCVRLDGIPLAIELAAARISGLTLERIAAGLRGSFELLIGKEHARPERQRTLRAAVEWSHNLLSADQQRVFHRLGAMAGWWSMEAAESICGDADAGASHIVDIVADLVEKSLVVREEGHHESCYRLLAPLHDFAQAQLAAAGEAVATRDRHKAFFMKLAERAEPEMHGSRQVEWMLRLDRDLDNLRVAVRTAHVHSDAECVLRLTGALWWYLWVRGHLREGVSWLEPEIGNTGVSARAQIAGLRAAAMLFGAIGRSEEAAAYAELMMAAARRIGDSAEMARAAMLQGMETLRGGDLVGAKPLFEQALALALEANDSMLTANALVNLGLTLPRKGHADQAESLHRRALALFEREEDVWGIAYASNSIACILRDRGDYKQATAFSSRAIRLLANLGDRFYLIFSIEDLARTCAKAQRGEVAAHLFGAAYALRMATGALLSPAVREDYERCITQLKTDLGRAGFDQAWTHGMQLSPGQLPDEANAREPAPKDRAEQKLDGPGGTLTRREREVARLIGQGRSNREIAKELAITVGTAGVHVEHILRKLDMRSRHQVADWARAKGLLDD